LDAIVAARAAGPVLIGDVAAPLSQWAPALDARVRALAAAPVALRA
jgi:hypothetical protein